jgi:RNA polymerase sigma-70 factor (ECF subfamily)
LAVGPPSDSGGDPALESFLAGDAAACRRVEEWIRRVVRYRGYYVAPDERDDVVQECLASVWSALSARGAAAPDSFAAFVRQVAHRRCVDWLRRLRPTAELSEQISDPKPDPYERLLAREPAARIRLVLQSLEPRCRELFRLHYYEKLGFREIAQRLGTQEATQRVHMFHCTRKAREIASRWGAAA